MKINDIKTVQPGEKYEADIVVDRIEREGDAENKRPIVLSCRFEKTGNVIKLTTWEYNSLEYFRNLAESHHICNVSFITKIYNEIISFNLLSYKNTGRDSKLENKQLETLYYKNEIIAKINTIKNENYKKLLNKLLVEKFYKWPAAYSIHHAFPGGLVLHSFSVAQQAESISDVYRRENINHDILITGALLHDIGKLEEYSQNGKYSIKGNLLSHIILGIEAVNKACYELGIDSESDEILQIKHIIASHHGKLEFGSPVVPKTIEAFIISQADLADSKIEAIQEAFDASSACGSDDDYTAPIKALEGTKILIPTKYVDLVDE